MNANQLLRHHVTGAIERGEASPIVETPAPKFDAFGACINSNQCDVAGVPVPSTKWVHRPGFGRSISLAGNDGRNIIRRVDGGAKVLATFATPADALDAFLEWCRECTALGMAELEADAAGVAAFIQERRNEQAARLNPRVILVACVAEKAETAQPAEKLYRSPWFKKAAAYARRQGRPWFILSARHGLVNPATILEPYNVTLHQAVATERRAWAERVAAQLATIVPNLEAVEFVAGRDPLTAILEARGVEVSVPFEGLGIGEQLRAMTVTTTKEN